MVITTAATATAKTTKTITMVMMMMMMMTFKKAVLEFYVTLSVPCKTTFGCFDQIKGWRGLRGCVCLSGVNECCTKTIASLKLIHSEHTALSMKRT